MVSIDEFERILGELAEELPEAFYEGLNGGIIVEAGSLRHPESVGDTLYVLGQYRTDSALGHYIVLFYGSFARLCGDLSADALRRQMREVLRHEFRHHIEGRAGVRDLEVWDEQQLADYRAQQD